MGKRLFVLVLMPAAFIGLFVIPVMLFVRPKKAVLAAVYFDMFVNMVVFNGRVRQTLSAHSWEKRGRFWADCIIFVTGLLDDNHCEEAYNAEKRRPLKSKLF